MKSVFCLLSMRFVAWLLYLYIYYLRLLSQAFVPRKSCSLQSTACSLLHNHLSSFFFCVIPSSSVRGVTFPHVIYHFLIFLFSMFLVSAASRSLPTVPFLIWRCSLKQLVTACQSFCQAHHCSPLSIPQLLTRFFFSPDIISIISNFSAL